MVITNSEWNYASAMMEYAFDRYLSGMKWRELFDFSIVASRKPAFFEGKAPLLRVINDAGQLEPHIGPLEAGGAYFGGNAGIVEKQLEEIAHAIEQQRAFGLALQRMILLHHRSGLAGHGRGLASMAVIRESGYHSFPL